jgi:hypothetical protein
MVESLMIHIENKSRGLSRTSNVSTHVYQRKKRKGKETHVHEWRKETTFVGLEPIPSAIRADVLAS